MEKAEGQYTESEGQESEFKITPAYVKRFVHSAKEAARRHWQITAAAWAEYDKNYKAVDSILDVKKSKNPCYPLYRSSCKALEPAYYSRTPEIKSKRRFGADDAVANTMALINDRLGDYLQSVNSFDFIMQKVVLDFIHGDKAAVQVKFDAQYHEVERVEQTVLPAAFDPETEQFYDPATGEVYDNSIIQEQGEGQFVAVIEETIVEPQLTGHSVKLLHLPYNEVLHTPHARCEDEITEKAYYFYMEKPEAVERFPEAKLIFKVGKPSGKQGNEKDEDKEGLQNEYIEGWEFWCKRTKKVYWYSACSEDGKFLDVKDDPYGLRDFFPSTDFIMGSPPEKNMYPVSVFGQLYSLINQMHDLQDKIYDLIDKVRRRALVDGSEDDLIRALTGLDQGEFIACQNYGSIVEKGGIDGVIGFIPVKELVEAIGEMVSLQEKFKAEFFEGFGLPDILRGQTDQYETAKAQMLNASAGQDRFKFNKKLIGSTARQALQKMVDLAYQLFPVELIQQIVGFETWDDAHKEKFDEALKRLKDDEIRMVTIDISTDSMSFIDDELKAKRMHEGSTVFIRGLEQVAQMLKSSPQMAATGLQALLMVIDTMGLSKDFEEKAKSVMDSLMEQANQPPPPPPPDYEGMKIEQKNRELAIKEFEVQARAQSDAQENQIKVMKAQADAAAKYAEAQLKQIESVVVQLRFQMESTLNEAMKIMEGQRVANETLTAQVNAKESMLEEMRLASEMDTRKFEAAASIAQSKGAEEPQGAPPAVVNIINQPEPEPIPVPVPVDPFDGILGDL